MLYHGDCLEVMSTLEDQSIDMILCDLPYGTTACKWDVLIPFDVLWMQYKRLIKDNGAIVLFGTEPFSSHLRLSNISWFKYDWIWEKSKASNYVHAKYQPLKAHEIISVFSLRPAAHNTKWHMNYYPQYFQSTPYKYGKENGKPNTCLSKGAEHRKLISAISDGKRYPRSVLYFKTAESEGHFIETQKPVALCEYLISTYTQEGECVLDNCAGSGTTGVAAHNLHRAYILIEKDKHYIHIMKQRGLI